MERRSGGIMGTRDETFPPPTKPRAQTKPASRPGKPPRVKRGIVKRPEGSGPFNLDEITRGYRLRPTSIAVNTHGGIQQAGRNIDRMLQR